MKFISAVSILSLLAVASAAPAPEARAGPSGLLLMPNDGAVWDNTSGFGLGRVVYNGTDRDYTNSQGVNHVKTHHIDVSLEAQDGSGDVYYLAKGIAPPSGLQVDAIFQIPIGYGPKAGRYRLIVDETQVGSTPGKPIRITFRAAAPLINIVASAN